MSEEQLIPIDEGVEKVSIQTHDRITVKMSLYFSHISHDPFCLPILHSRFVRSSGIEVYSHHCKATPTWQVLDQGWIDRIQVGKLIIKNCEGDDRTQVLSEEERKASESRILQIAYEGAPNYCFYIHPGDAMPMLPNPAFKLMIRCITGTCPYRIVVFPG